MDFRPGNVYGFAQPGTYAATMVGAQPIWSDDVDSSYAHFGGGDAGGNPAQARANFPDGTFADVAAIATKVWLRVKVANPNLATSLSTVGINDGQNYVFANQSTDLVTGWNDIGPFTDEGPNAGLIKLGTLAQMLSTSGVFFYVTGPADTGTLDVLEAMVRVEIGGAVGYITALRQFQRGDGYGIGGVPRAVTGRTRQASLRSGPGAIL